MSRRVIPQEANGPFWDGEERSFGTLLPKLNGQRRMRLLRPGHTLSEICNRCSWRTLIMALFASPQHTPPAVLEASKAKALLDSIDRSTDAACVTGR